MNPWMSMRRRVFALLMGALLIGAGTGRQDPSRSPGSQASFASQVAELSEPGGYFDTDNLISNERSYLQVLPELQRAGLRGGAYIGVGPDQNFSYIADIRPAIAFIVDIRRDNLLLHLLFKALFEQARTRVEYLALLFGRPVPEELDGWREARVERLAAYIDGAPVNKSAVAALRARMDTAVKRFGVPLSVEDLGTIDRFHRRFIDTGLALRFESMGRPPQSYYPTYRELLLETDSSGRQGNFLASEGAFQFVKSLETHNLIVPVVGDLSGPRALAAIGRLLSDRGDRLSAFYTSNVEFYLERAGAMPRFVNNLSRIPHVSHAVIIRSIFGRSSWGSMSVVQPVDDLLAAWR